MILATLLLAQAAAAPAPPDEATYYTVDYLTPPEGAVCEVGGLDFLPDGRLVLSTRRGQVWTVENPLSPDPAAARFHLFAEGLWEGLGLQVVEGKIYVVQRQELSLLEPDPEFPNRCAGIRTITDDWGVSGNYHEFAYGLPVDEDGNFYVSLNVSFFNPKWWHGKSTVPYRGWVLRITPTGEAVPFASGFRSPCGLGMNAEGDLFVTDNQGDWMAASPVFHVQSAGFYGHPASLDWTYEYQQSGAKASDTIPPERASTDRRPAAVWLPYKWSRSPGNLVPDTTGGFFGPFEGQLFLAELTNGMILRLQLEKVNGEYQGMVVPFRRRVGSTVRVRFAPDGSLFAGFTNRGWGGLPPADGIGRIRWTGVVPMEVHSTHIRKDGFELTFTKPLAADLELTPEDVSLVQYDYDYWWEYGSPERATTKRTITAVETSPDRTRVVLRVADLEPAMVARMTLARVVADDGTPLLHEELAYTVNQIPGRPPTSTHVAKVVPPPPARESQEEGWLRLTYGNATDLWAHEGWELVDVELDADEPTRLVTKPGVNALANTASDSPGDYTSEVVLGDAEVAFSFFLPEDGDSTVWLMGRYGIALSDADAGGEATLRSTGALLGGPDLPARAAGIQAYRGPGQWHRLEALYRAPRFDESGMKTRNAHLVKVELDGVLLHEEVALPGPSRGAPSEREAPEGPLVFAGSQGRIALGDIRARPIWDELTRPDQAGDGWVELVDDDLSAWKISGDALWEVDGDEVVGEGPRGHLFSPRGDYTDLEVRGRFKISDGGNSGLYVRATYGDGWPEGYEAQINSSYADPQKTGSLYSLAPVETHLISPDTWFDYHVLCRDEEGGTRLVIRVNGVVVADYLETERLHASGHVVLQQHHESSVVEMEGLAVREL